MEIKYDRIGHQYDQTRKSDPYLSSRLLYHLAPRSEGLYLDIGCGTGNYTNVLHQRGIRFIGIDPSEKMLKKASARNSSIDWRIGTAEATGLETASVDGIMGSLTIHHWADLEAGFRELSRVLKANGRIVIFTATPQQMRGYWLNAYFPKMLEASIVQMPAFNRVKNAMETAGLQLSVTEPYYIRPDLEDKFLYCGKQNPALYLDPSIRNGISSFSDLANLAEVEAGLAKLSEDISSGAINSIIQSYENQLGDYLYLVAEKK